MSLLKRLFTIGRAEGNALVDQMEDPVKMLDQGIRDLKTDQQGAMKALAEVKAALIRSRRDLEHHKARAADYQAKARSILTKAKGGEMDEAEADRLAGEALRLAKQDAVAAERLQGDVDNQQALVDKLQGQINGLKSQIARYENEAKSLKARQKTASSVKKINKQLSGVDSSGTIAMLERMRDRVNEEESLAEAYTDLAHTGATLHDEIDKAALTGDSVDDDLAALKASL